MLFKLQLYNFRRLFIIWRKCYTILNCRMVDYILKLNFGNEQNTIFPPGRVFFKCADLLRMIIFHIKTIKSNHWQMLSYLSNRMQLFVQSRHMSFYFHDKFNGFSICIFGLTTLIQKQCNEFKSCVFSNLMIPVSTFIDFNV